MGDLVQTASGGVRPIVWIGDRLLECRRHPRPDAVLPIRIAAGAFAPGIPSRDLLLSPDHAVFAAGCLVPVKYLVNGHSVAQTRRRRVHYFHIELDRHDIVLADGLAAESFLDTGNRAMFAGQGVLALHPDFTAQAWEAQGCAPLVVTGPVVDRLRAGLARARVCA